MANSATDLKPKDLASAHRALKLASKMVLRDDRVLFYVKSIKSAVEASLLGSICVYDQIIPLLRQIVGKKGPTILDIGANMEQFALRVARQFPAGRIYSFEPVHDSAMRLRRARRWLRADNISVHEEAMCDAVGTETIHVPVLIGGFRDGALAVLEGSRTSYDNVSYQTEAVMTNTVDAFRKALGLERVDFIKVDTEGAESRVIEGAQDTIERLLPALYLETPLERPWLSTLYDLGYQPFNNDGEKLFTPRKGMRQNGVLLVHSSKNPQIAGLRAES